jgi:hypothetical protein
MRAPIVSPIDHFRLPGTKTKRRKDVKLNTWIGKIRILMLGFALIALVVPFFPGQHVTAAVSSLRLAPPIAVDNPAAFPFETNVCVDNASGATCAAEAAELGWPLPATFTVPTTTSGKAVGRLVINYVSGVCNDAFAGTFLITPLSENSVNEVTAGHNFFTGQIAGTNILIQQATTIYVDPGVTVKLFVNQWNASDGACFLNVNGDLVTG